MRKKSLKRLLASSLLLIAIMVTSITAFAGDDNISFQFNIKPYYGNGYSSTRYRETTRNNNPWKVNMTYSQEGTGKVSVFWLSNSSYQIASEPYNVQQGSGAHRYAANDYADATNVCLGAEDNNNIALEYTVAGYWDEETGGTV